MLRLVKGGEPISQNDALRTALDRVTRGGSTQVGLPIFEEHEAKALYSVLVSRPFTQDQLDTWIDRLCADHPYDRRVQVVSKFSFWSWVKYIFFGGEKPPEQPEREGVQAWRKRAEAFVDEQKACVDQPVWIQRPLMALDTARFQIEHKTGERQWAMVVLRWALVQLLTTPADVANSDNTATG